MLKIDKNLDDLFRPSGQGAKLVTFVNPFSYYRLKDECTELVLEMDHVFADGIMLVTLNNLLYSNGPIKRYSFDFTSLAPVFLEHAASNKMRVALIGGTEDEIYQASKVLLTRFPALKIPFYRNGFFSTEFEISKTIQHLSELKIDVVICGMGTPLQEKFIVQCKHKIPSLQYGITCGGFFSQISMREDYFNPFLDKLHLRWFQRMVRHSYVRKRLLIDYPAFTYKFIRDRFF